jgi:hypothetical protein
MKWSKGLKIKKDPNAILDYAFDWTEWLDGDTIASYTIECQPGLTLANQNLDTANKKVIVWLSGGTPGSSYSLLCRVHSVLGRIDDRTVVFVIEDV